MEKILILPTADGSPTARFRNGFETMHSEAGALAETRYIYGPAVERALQTEPAPHFCSVGLGLGYNDLLIAADAGDALWTGESYEADEGLRENFLGWLSGETSSLTDCYQTIASAFGACAREHLQKAWRENRWRLHGRLDAHSRPLAASAILYDAFSRASSPELWDENFLNAFLVQTSRPACVFATYASVGPLKRVLRNLGFQLETRRGFGAKRECTFAIR